MRIIKIIKQFLLNMVTKNYCDTCGFTDKKIFVTEYYTEGGLIQCYECSKKDKL